MPRFQLMSTIQILREVNLAVIKRDAEGQFSLLVIGSEARAAMLAEALGDGGPVHPWLHVLPLPLPELPLPSGPELAILTLGQTEPDAVEAEALRRLRGARIPTLVAVMTDEPVDSTVDTLVRLGEAARVVLPAVPYPTVLRGRLAPALLGLAAQRDPDLPLALARQLSLLRELYVHRLIEDVSRANATYAATTGVAELVPGLAIPLTAADIIVLTKNQVVMAYKIALASGKNGSVNSVLGELLGVLGGSLLFRQIARELVGLIPLIGLVPKIAIAYGGTWVIGRATYVYASEGRVMRGHELRQLYDAALQAGRVLAEEIQARLAERTNHTPDEPAQIEPPAPLL